MSDSYQIETATVAVEIHFETGAPLQGQVFLRPGAAAHYGTETLADRLNDGSPFFPVRVKGPGESVLLVSKARVRYVIGPSSAADERVASERAAATQVGVQAVFEDGSTTSGILFIDLPPEQCRPLDYVNDPGRHFVALAQPGRDLFVNRALVRYFRDSA